MKNESQRLKKNPFKIVSDFKPNGDQPQAIKKLTSHIHDDKNHQVLLGVTGSGKTFTMAHVIEQTQLPALILAPNKTLAAQLFSEFKELFPNNAVEYFVSYYDYYQPEAYVPTTDTFIEKDSAINEQIDLMRHSATRSLFERSDVIIVSSVSCIYGLGSPDEYEDMSVELKVNEKTRRDKFLRELINMQYNRRDIDFHRGTFRVRGDTVELFPAYEDSRALRIEFFGDFIECLSWVDPLTAEVFEELTEVTIYPGSHYVTGEEKLKNAIKTVQEELRHRLNELESSKKLIEAERLEQRTYHDIEILEEMGFCPGIENYSRHITGRNKGEPPPTLLEFFPTNFITFLDESHLMVPQLGAMYRGDNSRKSTLVEHGFRLPSALDNRPLNFDEVGKLLDKVIYVSATPSLYEVDKSEGLVVEQLIRPTGLLDPVVEVRPATHQVDDILKEVRKRVEKKERTLITTLTKKSAEDLTEYLDSLNIKVRYLHSDIKTMERSEIIRDLRLGVFDVLVGINLLREGLDIPEVSLVAITDADKEGFLRSERSLIQTIGRAARNAQGFVVLYADRMTDSIKKAMKETSRRRQVQDEFNQKNGITPKTIEKTVKDGLIEIYQQQFEGELEGQLKVASQRAEYLAKPEKIPKQVIKLRKKMQKLAEGLEFEEAARVRDEIKRLELMELASLDGDLV